MLNSLPQRLKQLLSDKKWEKIDFARKMNISMSFAVELVNGNKRLTLERLIQIYEISNVNLHWLITGEGSMYRKTSAPLASVKEDVDELVRLATEIAEKVKSSS
jgi:transcriptional regulator with XRE-family HTH domain